MPVLSIVECPRANEQGRRSLIATASATTRDARLFGLFGDSGTCWAGTILAGDRSWIAIVLC
jgi:hypothetical protein